MGKICKILVALIVPVKHWKKKSLFSLFRYTISYHEQSNRLVTFIVAIFFLKVMLHSNILHF